MWSVHAQVSSIFSSTAPKGPSRNERHVGDSHSCKETVELGRTQAIVSCKSAVSQPHNHPGQRGNSRVGIRAGRCLSWPEGFPTSTNTSRPDLRQVASLHLTLQRKTDTGIPYPDACRGVWTTLLRVVLLYQSNRGHAPIRHTEKPFFSSSLLPLAVRKLLQYENSGCIKFLTAILGFTWFIDNSANFPLFSLHTSHSKAGTRLAEFQTFTFNVFFPSFIHWLFHIGSPHVDTPENG